MKQSVNIYRKYRSQHMEFRSNSQAYKDNEYLNLIYNNVQINNERPVFNRFLRQTVEDEDVETNDPPYRINYHSSTLLTPYVIDRIDDIMIFKPIKVTDEDESYHVSTQIINHDGSDFIDVPDFSEIETLQLGPDQSVTNQRVTPTNDSERDFRVFDAQNFRTRNNRN